MKKKTLLIILCIFFVASLLPLYFIGQYNHPSVDDYYYGVQTAATWQTTGSLGDVIKESFHQMVVTYNEWQGNFAAIFLMRLQPGIFGEQFYALAPVILITSFVIAMLGFFYVFLRKWFNAGRTASITAGLCITFCALQFTHVPSDSFYWYNGSIYYTFFFSLMLILFILVTQIIHNSSLAKKILCTLAAVPLAFVIGGGNYATALFTVIIMILMCIWLIITKKKQMVPVIAITLVSLVALGISILAPGNSIRQESVGAGPGVIKALIYSFAYGGYNIAGSTTAPVIAMWILLLPVFYKIASNTKYSFKYPLLVLIFTYGVFCSQGTPVFYAQGLRMPYRMMNIIYFSYYIFMTLNLIYLMGWIHRKWGETPLIKKIMGIYDSAKSRTITVSCLMIFFAIGCIGLCTVSEGTDEKSAEFGGLPMSVGATYSIINGDAAAYNNEINARIDLLLNTADTDVTVSPLSVTPNVIFHTDITTDPSHWKNQHLAMFYHKNSVRLSGGE